MEDAKLYYELGLQVDKTLEGSTVELKAARIKVASQLFWYAGVSAIEFILIKRAGVSMFEISDHSKRLVLMEKCFKKFHDINVIEKYRYIYKNGIRTETAYKGKNGNKYKAMKEFADLCMQELKYEN